MSTTLNSILDKVYADVIEALPEEKREEYRQALATCHRLERESIDYAYKLQEKLKNTIDDQKTAIEYKKEN